MSSNRPLPLVDTAVAREWIDYNGHMNDAAYSIVFSRAVDVFMDRIGIDEATRKATGYTLYTLKCMVHFLKEARVDTPLSVTGQIIEHDNKRVRLWLNMTAGPSGPQLATSEQLLISIDHSGDVPKAATWRPSTLAALGALAAVHRKLATPIEAGQGISLLRKR
jgi:acyl-CoA thioester hydrolase